MGILAFATCGQVVYMQESICMFSRLLIDHLGDSLQPISMNFLLFPMDRLSACHDTAERHDDHDTADKRED